MQTYWSSGQALRQHTDGRRERVCWVMLSAETRHDAYGIRLYSDRETVYSWNCCHMTEGLPRNRPAARKLLERWKHGGLLEAQKRLTSLEAWGQDNPAKVYAGACQRVIGGGV
jgi:hypothetical protein